MSAVLVVEGLPDEPLAAAAAFFRDHLDEAKQLLAAAPPNGLVIQLGHADHSHRDWRMALARDLARTFTPTRVNVIGVGSDDDAAAMLAYLSDAPGVTGQYLQTDG